MKGYSYTSTPPMGRTAPTEPQCLYRVHFTFTFLNGNHGKHLQKYISSCIVFIYIYLAFVDDWLSAFIVKLYALTFRHRASYILGQAFRYSPENVFYIFNQ